VQRLAHAALTRRAAWHRIFRVAAWGARSDAGEHESQDDESDEEYLGHADYSLFSVDYP